MGMGTTVGYGSAAAREKSRPVFVVKSSELFASVEDQGWDEVAHRFFLAGAALEHEPARPAPRAGVVWRMAARLAGVVRSLIAIAARR
jgi:hypothetical protein